MEDKDLEVYMTRDRDVERRRRVERFSTARTSRSSSGLGVVPGKIDESREEGDWTFEDNGPEKQPCVTE